MRDRTDVWIVFMSLIQVPNEEKENFYQSKYDYYRKFNTWVIIVACIGSVSYFISDCQLLKCFSTQTLLPRTFILLPLILFLIINKRVSNYKVMVALSYLVIHGIIWCMIWAITFLPDRIHANAGFIIMQLLFFAGGFCAPFKYSTVAHSLLVVDIVVSNLFHHYESFDLILSMGIPCVICICIVHYVMESVYQDQYLTKKELEKALTIDYLTQAYNRNKLKDISDESGFRLLDSMGEKACIMVVDIDYFKKVNDTYGHSGGDQVLVYLVETIKSCIREEDYVIRWGGEEFVIILTDCELEDAKSIAENIHQKIQSSRSPVCSFTISIGVSGYDGMNYYTAINNADRALYVAKKTGRNKVVCYEAGMSANWESGFLFEEV